LRLPGIVNNALRWPARTEFIRFPQRIINVSQSTISGRCGSGLAAGSAGAVLNGTR
jgi:hypothetical protein